MGPADKVRAAKNGLAAQELRDAWQVRATKKARAAQKVAEILQRPAMFLARSSRPLLGHGYAVTGAATSVADATTVDGWSKVERIRL